MPSPVIQSLLVCISMLKGIVDILKEQGPKMALNACDKYLKKMPIHPLLQSIKAFLLVQMGKDQAGIELAKEVCSLKLIDTDVLMQLEKVYISVNDCKTLRYLIMLIHIFPFQIKAQLICSRTPSTGSKLRSLAFFCSWPSFAQKI